MTTDGPAIAVIVPVLRRPHRARPLVDSVAAATSSPYRVVFVCTAGDDDMIAACAATGADVEVIRPNELGDYAVKINHGYRVTDEPFIFTAADDLRFHLGWDVYALEAMLDPAIGVVGTQDLCNGRVIAGEHATHLLVRRSYVDRFGTIDELGKVMHEGYPHEYVDDELVATARFRRAWTFADRSVVEHLHPNVGKAPVDELYAAERTRMRAGRRVFRRREHMWTRP